MIFTNPIEHFQFEALRDDLAWLFVLSNLDADRVVNNVFFCRFMRTVEKNFVEFVVSGFDRFT